MPCVYMSHQRACREVLPDQSVTSNLLSLPARYMSAMAMISASHCRQSVVHRLHTHKPTRVKNPSASLCVQIVVHRLHTHNTHTC